MGCMLLAFPGAFPHALGKGPVRCLRSVRVISSGEQHQGRITSVCCVAVTGTHPGPLVLKGEHIERIPPPPANGCVKILFPLMFPKSPDWNARHGLHRLQRNACLYCTSMQRKQG